MTSNLSALANALHDLGAFVDGDALKIERKPGGDILTIRFENLEELEGMVDIAPSSGNSIHLYNPEHALWRHDIVSRVQIEVDRIRHARRAEA